MDPNKLFLDEASRMPLDAVMLRRMFLILTRVHYASPENYGAMRPAMEKYIYRPEPKPGTVGITLDEVTDYENEDLFPSIQVMIGDTKLERRVMKDVSDQDGQRGLVAGCVLQVSHFSKFPDEALQLASLTALFYCGMRDTIQEKINLLRFVPGGVTAPKKLESSGGQSFQLYRSNFQATIEYDYSWVTHFESHLIRTATVQVIGDLTSDLSRSQGD